MKNIRAIERKNAQSFEQVSGSPQSGTQAKSDAALFQEFGAILDKIAFKIDNQSESFNVSTAPVQVEQKVGEEAEVKDFHGVDRVETKVGESEDVKADGKQDDLAEDARAEAAKDQTRESDKAEDQEQSAADKDESAQEQQEETESEELSAEEDGVVLEESEKSVSEDSQSQDAAAEAGKPVTQALAEQVEKGDSTAVAEEVAVAAEGMAQKAEEGQKPLVQKVQTEIGKDTKKQGDEQQEKQPFLAFEQEQIVVDSKIQEQPLIKIAQDLLKRLERVDDKGDAPVIEKILKDFIEATQLQPQQLASSQLGAQQDTFTFLPGRLVTAQLDVMPQSKGLDLLGDRAVGKSTQALTGLVEKLQAQENGQSTKATENPKALRRNSALRALERVQQALKDAAGSKDGKSISLRLDPPSLGTVRVDVSLRDGVLHARVAADSTMVNQFLRDRAFELQRTLRELGLNVDQVSVSVRGDESNFADQFGATGGNTNTAGEESDERFQGENGSTEENGTEVGSMTQSEPEDHWVA